MTSGLATRVGADHFGHTYFSMTEGVYTNFHFQVAKARRPRPRETTFETVHKRRATLVRCEKAPNLLPRLDSNQEPIG